MPTRVCRQQAKGFEWGVVMRSDLRLQKICVEDRTGQGWGQVREMPADAWLGLRGWREIEEPENLGLGDWLGERWEGGQGSSWLLSWLGLSLDWQIWGEGEVAEGPQGTKSSQQQWDVRAWCSGEWSWPGWALAVLSTLKVLEQGACEASERRWKGRSRARQQGLGGGIR